LTPKPLPVTVSKVPPMLAPVFGVTPKKAGVKVIVLIALEFPGKPAAVLI
jgi:hypothetical protein